MKHRHLVAFTALCALGLTGYATASPELRHTITSSASALRDAVLGPVLPASEDLAASAWSQSLINHAKDQIGVTTIYDGSYVRLSYPMGDIDRQRGVCTDVLIRALRDAHNIDLQEQLHRDMSSNFSAYPKNWGLTKPDRNIDHRRVPNLRRYFERIGAALPAPTLDSDFQPGDIVTRSLGPGKPHIGIVSNHTTSGGRPLILHNVGIGTRLDDFLPLYEMTGHYRLQDHL